MATAAYTLGELMVAAAAREIRDGEVVFVGMRLPLIAFVVAKKTHAPNAVGLFENGVIRSTPARELIYTMADPPNILGATQCLDMLGVMTLLQSGRVNLGFLGAAEVDRYGNLNSTEVRTERRVGIVRFRLPVRVALATSHRWRIALSCCWNTRSDDCRNVCRTSPVPAMAMEKVGARAWDFRVEGRRR